MATVPLSLEDIYNLANKTLLANGCDEETSNILSDLIMKAERDGSLSHGLFRLPAYVAGLKSGQIHATIFEDARIAELLKRSSNINVFEKVAARWDILDFPALDQAPWNNKKFRQAIVAAIDNKAIMNLAINGKGTWRFSSPCN